MSDQDKAALAQQAAPAGRIVVTEEMHVAACKVLLRAYGMDGLLRAHGLDSLPQRMLDAMLAAAPAAPQAEQQAASDDIDNLLSRFERHAQRFGELWERCQGKGWPTKESEEFTALRDDKLPALKKRIRVALAAQQAEQQAEAAPGDMVLVPRQLLKDAAESVDDYRCALEFGAFDRKLLGRLKAAAQQAEREPLTAGDLKEPKNGQAWRVEWWNEAMRLMLPKDRELTGVQHYGNGTIVLTIRRPEGIGKEGA